MTTTEITSSRFRSDAWSTQSRNGQSTDADVAHVFLVDDDRAASYSLRTLLGGQPGIRIVATAESSAEALALVGRLRPGVCLVSAALGRGEGIGLVHSLKQMTDAPRVLIHADRVDAALEGTAMLAGADGVLWRYGDPDELASVIRSVGGGLAQQYTPSPEVIGELIDRVEERDRAIAAMLLLRTPPDEIAHTLGISASAFRARRREIARRLGEAGRAGPLEHGTIADRRDRPGSDDAGELALERAG